METKIFGVQIAYFDYHGDSRSPYWRFPDEIEYYVTVTPEEMQKWLDRNNAQIVANLINEYEEAIGKTEASIAKNDRRNELIDSMPQAEALELGVVRIHPEVNERYREDIRKLRAKIEKLETFNLEEIYENGLVSRWWISIPIETKTLEQLDAELDK